MGARRGLELQHRLARFSREATMSDPHDFIFIQIGHVRLAAIGRLAVLAVIVVGIAAGLWLGFR
jgi:hypothetical protein